MQARWASESRESFGSFIHWLLHSRDSLAVCFEMAKAYVGLINSTKARIINP